MRAHAFVLDPMGCLGEPSNRTDSITQRPVAQLPGTDGAREPPVTNSAVARTAAPNSAAWSRGPIPNPTRYRNPSANIRFRRDHLGRLAGHRRYRDKVALRHGTDLLLQALRLRQRRRGLTVSTSSLSNSVVCDLSRITSSTASRGNALRPSSSAVM